MISLRTGLAAWWALDEESGNALDALGANHLTDTNTVGSAVGIYGRQRDFDPAALESFKKVAFAFGDEPFTFAGFGTLDTKGTRRMMLGKINSGGNSAFYIEYNDSSDRFVFRCNDGLNPSDATANNLGSPSTGVRYFIVAWRDSVGDTVNIQVNNGTANSTAFTGGALQSASANFAIGSGGDVDIPWDGLISKVGLWNRILTAEEKTALYNGGKGLEYSDFFHKMSHSGGLVAY